MLVARSLEEIAAYNAAGVPHAATIGNFDGVHVGHRELIRKVREKAAALGARSILVTFDPHPVHVIRGAGSPGIITPLPRKLELLEQAGLDAVLVLPFTTETAAMSAEEFVATVFVRTLSVKNLIVGYNFALGKNRSGNFTTLESLGQRFGFTVTQVQPVIADRETVSSSLIREHIKSGEMAKAAALLGRMHTADGLVVHGEARGRKLGYPTANIDFPEMLLPPFGAYATWLRILPGPDAAPSFTPGPMPGRSHGVSPACSSVYPSGVYPSDPAWEPEPRMSMTSVGTNPTFGGGSVTLESHIFDFAGDLYGKKVRLYFAERLRGEIRFKNVEDLAARLGQDAAAAKNVLERGKKPC